MRERKHDKKQNIQKKRKSIASHLFLPHMRIPYESSLEENSIAQVDNRYILHMRYRIFNVYLLCRALLDYNAFIL